MTITEGAQTTATMTGVTNGTSYAFTDIAFTDIAFNEGEDDGSLESAASNAAPPVARLRLPPRLRHHCGFAGTGDKVDGSLTNGVVSHFVVQTVETYSKSQFPASPVYASHGYSAFQLVTCGGKLDKATGHYESSVAGYTTLASTSPAGS